MEIIYDIKRSNRKTVSISVGRDGTVTVKAPLRAPVAEIERIVQKHSSWITKKLLQQSCDKRSALSDEDREFLRAVAKKVLVERLYKLSEITGLTFERVRISSAEKRFGSCTSKGTVSLSFYVLMYPEAAQDLVLLHELCHLRHMNHSKDFYSLLSAFLPDHKARKKLLSPEYMRSIETVREIYSPYL